MKNINFRKILSFVLAAFVAFGTLSVGTFNVYAEDEQWTLMLEDSIDTTIWTGQNYWIYVNDINSNDPEPRRADVTSAKTSNKRVFKIGSDDINDEDFLLIPVKPGTAKLTVYYETPSGETRKLSKKIVVKKYPKQIKSLRLNGKKVNTNKHKYSYIKKVSKSTTKVRVKMALKKGWKITKVYGIRMKETGPLVDFKISKSAVKKGKSIKFSKDSIETIVVIEMKKGKNTIDYWVYFSK